MALPVLRSDPRKGALARDSDRQGAVNHGVDCGRDVVEGGQAKRWRLVREAVRESEVSSVQVAMARLSQEAASARVSTCSP